MASILERRLKEPQNPYAENLVEVLSEVDGSVVLAIFEALDANCSPRDVFLRLLEDYINTQLEETFKLYEAEHEDRDE